MFKKIKKFKESLAAPLFLFFSVFNINSCYAVTVGDSYGGGTVFCVSKTPDTTQCVTEGSGDYGLIMANEDQVNFDSNPKHGVTWSSAYKEIGPGAQSDDDGAANTAAIIAALPQDNPSNNAVWSCHNYKDPIEGHADWYLPSRNELNKMYIYAKAHNLIGKNCSGSKVNGVVQCLVGGHYNPDYNIYWNSSESSGLYNYAWAQYFSNGLQNHSLKINYYFGVRSIRAFNDLTIKPFNNLNLDLTHIEGNDNDKEKKEKKKPIVEEKVVGESYGGGIVQKLLLKQQKRQVTVGDSYGGGTVFCVSKTPDITQCVPEGSGDYGLIMANEDQVNLDSNPKHGITWSSTYKIIPGALSKDNGAANTAAIIAAFPEDNPSNNAAWACHDYKDPIEGHTDWYLPSKNELYKIYLYAKAHNLIGKGCSGSKANGVVQCLVGGHENLDYKTYWSSSEFSGDDYAAWLQDFSRGDQYSNDKVGFYFGVRAIRAFNDLAIQQFAFVESQESQKRRRVVQGS